MTLTTLDPIEQEIEELVNRLAREGPKPRQICGEEANQIIRFLRENPTVKEFSLYKNGWIVMTGDFSMGSTRKTARDRRSRS